MRNKPTAKKVVAPLGLPLSLALHFCVIAASLFSWSHTLDIKDLSEPVVPVELVTLSDKTDITPMHTEDVKQPATPQEEPTAVPTPAPKTPDEVAPTPPDVHALPRPQAPAPKSTPAPPVKVQPRPAQTPSKANDFNLDNILALVDKKKAAAPAWKNGKLGPQNLKGYGMQDAMTADLRALLQSEIYHCWSPPVGAPHPEQLLVQFRLHLNRDGSIARAPELGGTSLAPDNTYMRAAIEAARRAIYTCAPYKLPANRYNQWQDIIFVFDPRAMMAQ